MADITLTWYSKQDARTCPICKALHGHTWRFKTGIDTFPNILIANGRQVWNIFEGSRAHGHERYNCRCQITSKIHIDDLIEKAHIFAETVKANIT